MVFTPPPPPAPAGFPRPDGHRRRGAPGIVAVLGLAVVIAVEYTVTVGPWLLFDGPYLSEAAGLGLSLVPFLLYVGLLVAVARTAVWRVAAAGVAMAAVVLHAAFWFVLRHAASSIDSIDDLRVLSWVSGAVVGMLLVAAWGLARRTGPAWWAGLLVVPAVIVGQALLDDAFSRWVWDTSIDLDLGGRWVPVFQVSVWTTWSLIPPLAAGIACWLLDQIAPGRRDQSS